MKRRGGTAIGELHPAQDHLARNFSELVSSRPFVAKNHAKDYRRRMALGDIEHRGDLALLHAMPPPGPRPPAAPPSASGELHRAGWIWPRAGSRRSAPQGRGEKLDNRAVRIRTDVTESKRRARQQCEKINFLAETPNFLKAFEIIGPPDSRSVSRTAGLYKIYRRPLYQRLSGKIMPEHGQRRFWLGPRADDFRSPYRRLGQPGPALPFPRHAAWSDTEGQPRS